VSLRVRDRLARLAAEECVGREAELDLLLECLAPDSPPVTHLHGVGGIGKSSLERAFADRARTQGAVVIQLDCRAIEPTEQAFLTELGGAVGSEACSALAVADRLSNLGAIVVLTLDTYEVFRLLDAWLRNVFVPLLPDNVRVLLVGREPPAAGWLASPGWRGMCRSAALGPLNEPGAWALLERHGLAPDDCRRLNQIARGHPLALALAAAAVAERPEMDLRQVAAGSVVEELSRMYLADVPDALTRQALEAGSVVRRVTVPLLAAMLRDAAPQDAFERLRRLPFVETARDGLIVHDVVQQAIASALQAAEPDRHLDYRRAAWRVLRETARSGSRAELWRYTADLLYMIENPVIHEAFFPTGASPVFFEPARAEDGPAIVAMTRAHDGPVAAALTQELWERLPGSFFVGRSRSVAVVGYYNLFDPTSIGSIKLPNDPVFAALSAHLAASPIPRGQRVLFNRRFLDLERGELPSPLQAGAWLEIKRTYMEMRPFLRRVYGAVREAEVYGPIFQRLGFQPVGAVELDGYTYALGVLDMGPGSVDAWLAGLVAAELGLAHDQLLDVDARELIVDGQRQSLTTLEFGVMRYLSEREGKAVTRVDLERDVWGYDYQGGSNVVDVVIRALRRKLGERASVIETVHGAGYRYRNNT